MKLQRDTNGSVVVDNYAVKDVAAAAINPQWYERIADQDLVGLARELDTACLELEELESARVSMVQSRSHTDSAYFDQLLGRMDELRTQVVDNGARLHTAGYCRCPDSHWYQVRRAPCGRSQCTTSCTMGN
jgi:hypothetical protein